VVPVCMQSRPMDPSICPARGRFSAPCAHTPVSRVRRTWLPATINSTSARWNSRRRVLLESTGRPSGGIDLSRYHREARVPPLRGVQGLERIAAFAAWKLKYAVERRAVSHTAWFLPCRRKTATGRRGCTRPPGYAFCYILAATTIWAFRVRSSRPGPVRRSVEPAPEHPSVRFLVEKVWPVVRWEIPDSELLVVEGDCLPEKRTADRYSRIRLAGFVENLESAYKSASVVARRSFPGAGSSSRSSMRWRRGAGSDNFVRKRRIRGIPGKTS